MNNTYKYCNGPYVKVMNGNEYISRPVLFIRANISSMHIIKSNAAISLPAMVIGFLVATTSPAKNDWDIPIYNNGVRYSMNKISYYM
jgi:hypothetical protein